MIFLWAFIFYRLLRLTYSTAKGNAQVSEAWERAGSLVATSQVLGVIEIVNSFFGLVRARWIPALLLHAGRDILLFGVLLRVPSTNLDWAVYGLFLAWAIGEVIRYPFYLIESLDTFITSQPDLLVGNTLMEGLKRSFIYRGLKYLRYTAPLFLLPIGFFTEMRLFYLALTTSDVITPPITYALYGYCFLAYAIGAPYLYYSMYQQRKRKIPYAKPLTSSKGKTKTPSTPKITKVVPPKKGK